VARQASRTALPRVMTHVDAKKLGNIPDRGGARAGVDADPVPGHPGRAEAVRAAWATLFTASPHGHPRKASGHVGVAGDDRARRRGLQPAPSLPRFLVARAAPRGLLGDR
jgi:hypothetical protein